MNSKWLTAVVVVLLTLGPSVYGEEMKTFHFPGEVRTRSITDKEASKAFRLPPGIRFSVSEDAAAVDDKVVVRGELINEGRAVVLIVHPYGGDFPYGGTSPFRISFSWQNTIELKYTGEMFPPSPPRPMEILVPAKSKILFTAEIQLDRYDWHGMPEVLVDWGFYYFRAPYPIGTIKVVLPRKP